MYLSGKIYAVESERFEFAIHNGLDLKNRSLVFSIVQLYDGKAFCLIGSSPSIFLAHLFAGLFAMRFLPCLSSCSFCMLLCFFIRRVSERTPVAIQKRRPCPLAALMSGWRSVSCFYLLYRCQLMFPFSVYNRIRHGTSPD